MAWNHLSLGRFACNENCGRLLPDPDTDRLFLVSMFNPIASRDCRMKIRHSEAVGFIGNAMHRWVHSCLRFVCWTVCLLFALLAFDVFVGSAHLSRLI